MSRFRRTSRMESYDPWVTADEAGLVGAARDGNVDALTQLFRRHDDGLRSFVYGLINDKSQLDDVLQDTYLKACRSLPTFQSQSSFRTWLHQIAYRNVLDERRRRHLLAAGEVDLDGLADTGSAVDGRVAAGLDVGAALGALSERQRAAVLLVDGHGFENTEVAVVLGIAPGTVGVHLSRGREAMRAMLQDEEGK